MKTLQDLVDRLNGINHLKPFSIEHYYDKYYLVVEYSMGTKNTVVEFSQLNYRFHEDIAYLHSVEQNMIVNFLANSNPSDWVPSEKKYNVIVGKDTNAPIYAAYKKIMANEYIVCSHVYKDELRNTDELQFTEKDIEELKDCLPDYLSKIIDLGKTEVEG